MSRSLVVFLQGAAWEDRYQAVTLAVTAAALGESVVVALFFDALRRWVDGRFDEGAPESAAGARVASLRESIEEARRDLGLEVVACDTAVRLAGLDPGTASPSLDRIASLPSLWKKARDGQAIVV